MIKGIETFWLTNEFQRPVYSKRQKEIQQYLEKEYIILSHEGIPTKTKLSYNIDNPRRAFGWSSDYLSQSGISGISGHGLLFDAKEFEEAQARKPEPVKLQPDEFLFLGKTLPLNWVNTSLRPIHFLNTFIFKRQTSLSFDWETWDNPNLIVHSSSGLTNEILQALSDNRYSYSRNNSIGDCGFVSVGNFCKTRELSNMGLALFFALLEIALGQYSYVIFSTRSGIDDPSPLLPVNLFKTIASYSAPLKPLVNINNGDAYQLKDLIEKKDTGARGRVFGFINHAGLLRYYQSQEFAELKLQL